MKKYLLIGSGKNQTNKFSSDGKWDGELTTLDYNQDAKPDVVWDLNFGKLPFPNKSFNEIHAYQVLEHVGRQGDYQFFFRQFEEFARILRVDGTVNITVPWWQSEWAWGDPGHTRIFPPGVFMYLNQKEYGQVGKTTMTDYRKNYKADFEVVDMVTDKIHLNVVLKVRK